MYECLPVSKSSRRSSICGGSSKGGLSRSGWQMSSPSWEIPFVTGGHRDVIVVACRKQQSAEVSSVLSTPAWWRWEPCSSPYASRRWTAPHSKGWYSWQWTGPTSLFCSSAPQASPSVLPISAGCVASPIARWWWYSLMRILLSSLEAWRMWCSEGKTVLPA